MNPALLVLFLIQFILLIAFIKYRQKKKIWDYARAELAAKRIRQETGEYFSCSGVDMVKEVKTVLRYCRSYRVSLSTFGFNDESAMLEEAMKITKFATNPEKVREDIRARLAPYFLKCVTR